MELCVEYIEGIGVGSLVSGTLIIYIEREREREKMLKLDAERFPNMYTLYIVGLVP